MPITQVITTLPTAPDPSTMTRDEFSAAAAASVLAQKAMVPEINAWTAEVNAIVSGTAGDIASGINGATAKTTPVDADLLTLTDSAASFVLKKFTWANLKTTLASTFSTLTQLSAAGGAALIGNTPAGSIAATTVQAAINELDAEKAALAGSASQAFATNELTASGGIQSISASALIGYGTGAGGTVTQPTSKSTGVALNKPNGQITTHNELLNAGASVLFILSNSTISAKDTLIVNPSANTNYEIKCISCGVGYAGIRITNFTGSNLSEAFVINFAVIKGETA